MNSSINVSASFFFVLLLSIISPFNTDAADLSYFKARYQLTFENNRLIAVSDKSLDDKSNANQSIQDFQNLIAASLSLGNSMGVASFNELEQFVQSLEFEKLLTQFDQALSQKSGSSSKILCLPYQKLHFWKTNLGREALQILIGQVLNVIPYANLLDPLRVILNFYYDLKQEQIKYHSNVLRSYLLEIPAENLDMTVEDAKGCLASLYDRQLSLFNLIAVYQLNKYWKNYPAKDLAKQTEKMKKRQNRWKKYFIEQQEWFGPYHQEMTTKKQERVIVDWEEPIYLFFKKPSLIHFYHKREYVKIKRTAFRWLELASKVLPIPVLGSAVSFLTKQNYSNQVQNEALLMGHLESNGQVEFSNHIARQTGNPLISRSMGQK